MSKTRRRLIPPPPDRGMGILGRRRRQLEAGYVREKAKRRALRQLFAWLSPAQHAAMPR
jgi:hypothetical protein